MIYSLVFVKQRRFWCLYPISNRVLSGCGGNTDKPASKQNPCMCSHWVCFSLTISTPSLCFLSLSLSLSASPSPCSSLLSTPFLSPFHQTLSLSLCACGPAPAMPGKSWLWYPRKTSQRVQREAGGEYLTQHIYSAVDILVFLTVKG